MKRISTLLLALLLIFSFHSPSRAAGYELTLDTTGTLPTMGNVKLLSNGHFVLIGMDNTFYRYDAQMNLLASKSLGQFLSPIFELSGNRMMAVHGNDWVILSALTGDKLAQGKVNEASSGVMNSFLYGTELSNGNLLLHDNRATVLVNKNLQFIKQVEDNTVSLRGQVKIKGDIVTAIMRPGDYVYHFAKISESGELTTQATEIPAGLSSMSSLPDGNIIVDMGTKNYEIYNPELVRVASGSMGRYHIIGYDYLPVGDGNFMHIGQDGGSYGFEVISPTGQVLTSITNNNIAAIQRLSSGRVLMLNADNSFSIFKSPGGKSTSEVTTIETPHDLKNIGTPSEPIVTWKPDAVTDISHYEVYLDNAPASSSLTQNSYKPALAESRLYKVQVLAVDTGGKKTELSDPLYIQKSDGPAPGTDTNTSATITSGLLSIQPSAISFSDVTISHTAPMVSSGNADVIINDSRGTGAGWSMQLAVSDFESNPISNPSGSGTFKVRFPASYLTFAINDPTLIAGQSIDSTKMTVSSSGTLSNAGQSLVNSIPGAGMGIYNIGIKYAINVPKKVTVLSITDPANSKLSDGDLVGLYAGIYTSTFTFTTGVGL